MQTDKQTKTTTITISNIVRGFVYFLGCLLKFISINLFVLAALGFVDVCLRSNGFEWTFTGVVYNVMNLPRTIDYVRTPMGRIWVADIMTLSSLQFADFVFALLKCSVVDDFTKSFDSFNLCSVYLFVIFIGPPLLGLLYLLERWAAKKTI